MSCRSSAISVFSTSRVALFSAYTKSNANVLNNIMSQSPNGVVAGTTNDAVEVQQADIVEEPQGAPSLFLQKIIGSHVTVRLNSGVDYVGILSCLDGCMNIAMEETEEFVAGQSKGRFGDAFIRGNTVLYIEAGKRT